MAHDRARCEFDARRIFVRLVGYHDDPAHSLGGKLTGQHRHGQTAVDRLPAGHSHGVVEQQFVGDVDVGGDGRAYRQHTRMGVSAVPEIREYMLRLRERRLTDPGRPLSTHLGKSRSRPIHKLREIMAAYARERAAALRNFGGGIMRAARAEIGRTAERHDIAAQLLFLRLEKGEPFGNPRRRVKAGNALRDDAGDLSRCQLAVRRQYPVAVFVELADDARPDVFTPIVELLLELILDDGAFFLDDEDFLEPLGKLTDALAFQRPGHRNLVQAEADLRRMRVVNPEIVERLAHIKVGFAGSDDTEARPGTVDDNSV